MGESQHACRRIIASETPVGGSDSAGPIPALQLVIDRAGATFSIDPEYILLVCATRTIHIEAHRFAREISVHDVAIVGAGSTVRLSSSEPAEVVALPLLRQRIQMQATAVNGEPKLLRRRSFVFDRPTSAFRESIPRAATHRWEPSGSTRLPIDGVYRLLISALNSPSKTSPWSKARSLKRAVASMANEFETNLAVSNVAERAGMTAKTLQRGIFACAGMTAAQFVANARLTAAREALSSARETRSIEAIAASSGFNDASSFARAYRRRFGEAPSATRARIHSVVL